MFRNVEREGTLMAVLVPPPPVAPVTDAVAAAVLNIPDTAEALEFVVEGGLAALLELSRDPTRAEQIYFHPVVGKAILLSAARKRPEGFDLLCNVANTNTLLHMRAFRGFLCFARKHSELDALPNPDLTLSALRYLVVLASMSMTTDFYIINIAVQQAKHGQSDEIREAALSLAQNMCIMRTTNVSNSLIAEGVRAAKSKHAGINRAGWALLHNLDEDHGARIRDLTRDLTRD